MHVSGGRHLRGAGHYNAGISRGTDGASYGYAILTICEKARYPVPEPHSDLTHL